MKFLGIITSGTAINPVEVFVNKREKEIILPGAGNEVNFLTGELKNLSVNYKLQVNFYMNRREVQSIILEPLEKIKVKNQPCDRLVIRSIDDLTLYAVFSYVFQQLKGADTDTEILPMLEYADIEKIPLAYEEFSKILGYQHSINSVLLDQPATVSITAEPFTDILIDEISVSISGIDINGTPAAAIPDDMYVLFDLIWSTNGQVIETIERHFLNVNSLDYFKEKINAHFKRDIRVGMEFLISVFPEGLGEGFIGSLNVKYSKSNVTPIIP